MASHSGEQRAEEGLPLSGETVVVSTPHKCKSVVRRERGAKRCLRYADLKMGVTDGAFAVLAFGLIFAYLMVPCRSADSTCSCSLLSMLEARFVNAVFLECRDHREMLKCIEYVTYTVNQKSSKDRLRDPAL